MPPSSSRIISPLGSCLPGGGSGSFGYNNLYRYILLAYSAGARCWGQFTAKRFKFYRGIGEHHDMMTPGAAAKNAGIIREIVGRRGVEAAGIESPG